MSNLLLDQKGHETMESVNLLESFLGFSARNVNAFSYTCQFSSSNIISVIEYIKIHFMPQSDMGDFKTLESSVSSFKIHRCISAF